MATLASDGLVNDRYRVDLYEVAWGHYCYPDHHIRWFAISKQRNLRFFDDRNVFIALMSPLMQKRINLNRCRLFPYPNFDHQAGQNSPEPIKPWYHIPSGEICLPNYKTTPVTFCRRLNIILSWP